MRSESGPRRRIAWQPETPMTKALCVNGSLQDAIVSMAAPRSLEGCPSGIKARAGIVSILGMLLEPGESAQVKFGGHYLSTGRSRLRLIRPPRATQGVDPTPGRASRMNG